MRDDLQAGLVSVLYHLKEMMNNGDIDPQWYYKALVGAAFEYVKDGQQVEAFTLLANIPSDYYAIQLLEHMEEDDLYCEQVLVVADFLVKKGLVSLDFSETDRGTMGIA